MRKKFIYLTLFFTLVLGLAEGQARGAYRAAYWDGNYADHWINAGDAAAARDALEAAGYEILDADQLKTFMDARIADGVASVVVLCKDVAPETVVETNTAECTLRKYLDAGGKVVFYGDIPFYNQGNPGGGETNWGDGGGIGILGFNTSSAPRDTGNTVTITDEGAEWGLTETWASIRPAAPGDVDIVLATDAAGNAAAWVKHYVPGDTSAGFVRIWDRGNVYSFDDLMRVAEYGLGGNPFPRGPNPKDGVMLEDTWVNLSWFAGDSAVSHDVYFGENFDDVNDGTGDTFQGNQESTLLIVGFPGFAFPDGLVPGTSYYWRIDEVNDTEPNSPWKGPVWSFWIPTYTAYDPHPPDGTEFVSTDVTLKWTTGFLAKLHTVYFGDNFDDVNNAVMGIPQPATTFTPGTLELEKDYYWRVDEFDAVTTHKGDVLSFKTQPHIPITVPNLIGWWKLDGVASGTTAVDWSGYNHHGTIMGDPEWVIGYDGDALELDGEGDYVDVGSVGISGMDPRTIAGWVRASTRDMPSWTTVFGFAHDGSGDGTYFDIEVDNAGNYGIYVYGWGAIICAVDTRWHYFAATYDGSEGRWYVDGQLIDSLAGPIATIDEVRIGARLNYPNYFPGLVDDVRIYNKALTQNEIMEIMRGDPELACDPGPGNGSMVDVIEAASLSWLPGEKAAQHDVYFGTDKDAVADADTSDTTGIYRGRQGVTIYTPPEVEWGGGSYYWRIDEYNTDATISKGNVWTFTVTDFIEIDDIEDYNDYPPDEIFSAWIDGWEVPTNGSLAGHAEPPFAETGNVHGGGQSMPVYYENNFKYSEVTMTLSYPRNWTEQGVGVLSLWFYGDASNAAERMYVNLNGIATIYHDNSDAALIDTWTEWTIDLQEFAAQGVNLANVNTISIGFGDKNSLQAGGSGMVLFDDIRLYRPAP